MKMIMQLLQPTYVADLSASPLWLTIQKYWYKVFSFLLIGIHFAMQIFENFWSLELTGMTLVGFYEVCI